MATISIVARKDKLDDDGTVPLYLRILHKDRRRRVSLQLRVKEDDWNENKSGVRRSHAEYRRVNSHLSDVKASADRALLKLKTFNSIITADRIKEAVQTELEGEREEPNDFITYAREVIRGYRKRGQHGTAKRYSSTINKLEAYQNSEQGRQELSMYHLTPKYLREYMTYLQDEEGNAVNTVNKDMRGIRAILYMAIRENDFPQEKNPFFHITLKSKPTTREALSDEEISAIEKAELKDGSPAWHARNCFLFAFYAGGMRISDISTIRWKHIDRSGRTWRTSYRMRKTSGAHSVALPSKAVEILENYGPGEEEELIFPVLDEVDMDDSRKVHDAIGRVRARVNKQLKRVQKKAEVDTNLMTHMARHSIAVRLKGRGWDVYDIQQILGHSSVKQTEKYLSGFNDDTLDDRYTDMF